MSVRVYCPICKGGNNVIWQGSLLEFGQELENEESPEWVNYAYKHEKNHNHQIMVSYPSGRIVPLMLSKEAKKE